MGETLTLVLAALWAISEVLTIFPGVKANGIFQLVVNILKTVMGKG